MAQPLRSDSSFREPLAVRIPKELGCAFTASFLVSPIVAVLDKAMVKEISGVNAFLREIAHSSSDMIFKPTKFFGGLPFRLTFAVYAGTYAVANCSEVLLDHYHIAEQDQKRKPVKVGLTSFANVSLLLWRDSIFARTYSGAPKPNTPFRTLTLFAVRDTATMAATFYGAPKAANYLIKEYEVNQEVARISMALVIPGITQIITAPVHIHALDYYARPDVTFRQSIARIGEEFRKIAFARTLRVLPAFGIGSYSNNLFREMVIADEPFQMASRIQRRITLTDTVLARSNTSTDGTRVFQRTKTTFEASSKLNRVKTTMTG